MIRLHRRRPARGFTLLELIVVVCLVAVLAAVLLERLLRYQELAEKTAMEQTVGVLRSALALQFAGRVAVGGLAAAQDLAGQNPMDWLAERPPNYIGVLYDPSETDVAKGNWYFDKQNGDLVYRPRRTQFFTPGPDGKAQVRFRPRILIGPGPAVQGRPGLPENSELRIVAAPPYLWTPENF